MGLGRPPWGYPHACLLGLVLYDGYMSRKEAGEWYRGYDFNWRVKGIIRFGEPIMNVRGKNGAGVLTGTQKINWWEIKNSPTPNKSFIDEIKRRLPNIFK